MVLQNRERFPQNQQSQPSPQDLETIRALGHTARNHLMCTTLLAQEAARKHALGILAEDDFAQLETELQQLSTSIRLLLEAVNRPA